METNKDDQETDGILPEQFWSAPATPSPGEVGLLWSVFTDGICTYQDAVLRGATRGPEFRETESWLLSPETGHVTSFLNLCDLFGINATRLRLRLLQLREESEQAWRRKAG